MSTNNKEDDDPIINPKDLFDDSDNDVSGSLFDDSDSENEIENQEQANRVKCAKLILSKKDINKEKSKSDDLEKEKKDILLLPNTKSSSELKQFFTSDLGYFICTWLFCSLSDNKLSYKYNPTAIVDARCVAKDLNLALYTPNLVSQK